MIVGFRPLGVALKGSGDTWTPLQIAEGLYILYKGFKYFKYSYYFYILIYILNILRI